MATRTPTAGMAHLTVVPENFGDESGGESDDDEAADAVVDGSAGAGSRD